MRARILAGGSASGLLVCAAFLVHRLVLEKKLGVGAATMLASVFVFALPLALLRGGAPVRLAGVIVPVGLALLLPFDAYQNGGLGSASLTAMLPVPLVAGFFVGSRASLAFAVVLAAETIALGGLSAAGVRFPVPPDASQAAASHAVAVVALLFFVSGLTRLFAQERARAMEQLARSERRYELAAKETNDGFFDWAPGRTDMHVSERFLELLGLPGEGKRLAVASFRSMIHEQDRPAVDSALDACLAGRGPLAIELRLCRPDGDERWVDARAHRIDAGTGEPASVIGTVRDTTARKRLDTLKTDFVSTVSHELRTPLTSIRGSVALVAAGAAGPVSAEGKEMLSIAERNVERLIHIVNDLLDMQKIEAGALEVTLLVLDLNELVRSVAAATRPMGRQASVRIDVSTGGGHALVRADPQRLAQVVTNLLSNAIKVSPAETTVRLVVTADRSLVRLDVVDDGPGVPEEFRDRIFGKFAQASSGSGRTDQGTGIGLALSRAIIERLGGTLGYENLTRGACFSLVLPLSQECPH